MLDIDFMFINLTVYIILKHRFNCLVRVYLAKFTYVVFRVTTAISVLFLQEARVTKENCVTLCCLQEYRAICKFHVTFQKNIQGAFCTLVI